MSSSEMDYDRMQSIKTSRFNSENIKLKLIKQEQRIPIQRHQTFHKLKKNTTNLFNQNLYTDDHFKLPEIIHKKQPHNKISLRRLKDIIPPGTLLFGEQLHFTLHKIQQTPSAHFPSFISELAVLPFWHYETLIEPKYVNENGFYHVVVCKEGRMIRQTIDDTFYFDETFKKIHSQYHFQSYIWMHILLKVWAKIRGGYDQIPIAEPFEFVKTFSYPDWKVINPALEDIQKMITTMHPIQKREMVAVALTKKDMNVGLFGLVPNSAGYLVTGHYMEFEAVFVKVKALNGSKWNGLMHSQGSSEPEERVQLESNQFMIPLKQFCNLFHLIYVTSNKFEVKEDIFYTRHSLNLDARESKAKMILFQVHNPPSATESTMQKEPKEILYTVNLTVYFPAVQAYDFNRQQTHENSQHLKIPKCKLIFGHQQETTNHEASFVESMKQMMLENQDEDFLYGRSSMQYQWVEGTYFKGYDHTCTFLMKLKPGRYFLRFKMETLRVQYRANINVVSSTQVRISDPKMDKKEQQQFLSEVLSSKARIEKRNIGYLNPIKKGSWFICNDDFNSLGYGYLVVQTVKSSEYKIELQVDPKAIISSGYRLKSKKDQNKYMLTLKEGEGCIIILKMDDNDQPAKQRVWPPKGIEITRLMKS